MDVKSKIRLILKKTGVLSIVRKVRTTAAIKTGKVYKITVKLKCNTKFMGGGGQLCGAGGWMICPDNIDSNSIVYSFGLGDNISFDLDIIQACGCKVFGADPTPKSIEYLKTLKLPEQFKYWDVAIADYDGEIELFFPENEDHISLLSGDDGKRNGQSKVF